MFCQGKIEQKRAVFLSIFMLICQFFFFMDKIRKSILAGNKTALTKNITHQTLTKLIAYPAQLLSRAPTKTIPSIVAARVYILGIPSVRAKLIKENKTPAVRISKARSPSLTRGEVCADAAGPIIEKAFL